MFCRQTKQYLNLCYFYCLISSKDWTMVGFFKSLMLMIHRELYIMVFLGIKSWFEYMWGSYCCQETASSQHTHELTSMNSYFFISLLNSVKQTVHFLLLMQMPRFRVRRESAAVTTYDICLVDHSNSLVSLKIISALLESHSSTFAVTFVNKIRSARLYISGHNKKMLYTPNKDSDNMSCQK